MIGQEMAAQTRNMEQDMRELKAKVHASAISTPLRGIEAVKVPASSQPAPTPVTVAQLQEIAPGTSRGEVVSRLGEPHGRIAGMDEKAAESWTYLVEGGGFARVRLENGVVAAVVLPYRVP